MKQKKHFEEDSRRNILQELIDEVQMEEFDEEIDIKSEPVDVEELFEEEELNNQFAEAEERNNQFAETEEPPTDDEESYLEGGNKRGANYTNYEKFLLMKLVDKYRSKLINRGSDSVVRSEKVNTWEAIAKEFRDLCPGGQYRTAQKLRDKFSDMKKVYRKTIKYSSTRDKEFYLMKKLLENNFDDEALPEPPASALTQVLSETPVCIEALPDYQDEEQDDDEVVYSVESIPEKEPVFEEVPKPMLLSAQEQYYLDKNKREEEEHRVTMEILKLRAQKEALDIKFRTEEHEMRKDVLCREMEKND